MTRIPAKVENGKIVSFAKQDKSKWNNEFIKLGFYYLEKQEKVNKYYVEALIASKHMTATQTNKEHWNEIIKLYQLMLSLSNSPIIKLNLCYSLSKAKRIEEAIELLKDVEKVLPNEHIYLSLVKANIFKNKKPVDSEIIIEKALKNIKQKIRREYILENISTDF